MIRRVSPRVLGGAIAGLLADAPVLVDRSERTRSRVSTYLCARRLGRPRLTRRGLQILLGLVWLLDGALQLQPFMLGTGFATQIVAPAGNGQPHLVAGPVHWAASVIAAHPVAWDVPFACVQLLLGLGMLAPRTARLALAASLPWSLGVWFFGEGLSGLAGGHASLLTGAPGAALLYGLFALAAWPRRGASDDAPASWLPVAWAVLWVGGAVFQALPGQNSANAIAGVIAGGAGGAPGWLHRLDTSVAGWIGHHGTSVVVALVAVEALIGLAALHRRSLSVAAAAGFALALGIWVVGQDLGQLYSGHATDPNTAALIALMAVALPSAGGKRADMSEPASRTTTGRHVSPSTPA
jgi:hypothetical protein